MIEVEKIYQRRFEKTKIYRNRVWQTLTSKFFQSFVNTKSSVLDLGCGYGEFIRNINCGKKFALDLNIDSKECVDDAIFIQQDCTKHWELPEKVDVIFTSNFLEHLPTKGAVESTISQCFNNLNPAGIFIAMGPNINVLHGKYWDFWDHHTALTNHSLSELLELKGFSIIKAVPKFLPYSIGRIRLPKIVIHAYIRLPVLWKLFGKQFLIIAKKP